MNGDLSEIPLFEDVLFTIINEDTGNSYVICDELNTVFANKKIAIFGRSGSLEKEEKVIAWTELPEPYEPGGCDNCKHRKQWTDEFGDRWTKCALWPDYKKGECLLKKED